MARTLVNNTVIVGNGLEYYVSPNILTNDDQEERTARLQLRVNQQLKAHSRKLELPCTQEDIDEQLSRRPGVIRPGSGLTTSQATVETIPPAPAVLLASPAQDKPKAAGIRHNRKMEMKFNNFIYAGGRQYDQVE